MPKKKKMDELKLQFTGKMTMIIELEGHGPLIYNVNDLSTVSKAVKVILDSMNNTTPVNSYNKREEVKFKKILESFE